jgi:chromate reductase
MNLLGVSGALRRDSFNTALVRAAAEAFAPGRFEMADLRLPLYDGDLEAEGMPASVLTLDAQIRAADALVISTPEYNKGLSGVLKNALDWISRVKPQPLAGKPVAILSAAAGRAGGERAQMTLRACLVAFGPSLLQQPEVFVAGAERAFEAGRLADPKAREAVARQMAALRALVAAQATARR